MRHLLLQENIFLNIRLSGNKTNSETSFFKYHGQSKIFFQLPTQNQFLFFAYLWSEEL